MYTERNFKTKKALRESFERGDFIGVYQPGPFGTGREQGIKCLEGPHYPQPHTWYAEGQVENGQLIALKGSKAKWVSGTFVPAPPKKEKSVGAKGEAAQLLRQDMREEERRERLKKMDAAIVTLFKNDEEV